MNREKLNFLAGMFVMAGIFLILFIIFTLARDLPIFSPTSVLYSRYKNISWLKVGAIVSLSGYNVGNVRSISFQDDGEIIVELDINNRYMKFISEDSVASIVSTGLLGDKAVYIARGSSEKSIEAGMKIASKEPFELDNALEGIESLARIFSQIEQGHGNLGILINDDELYRNLVEGAKNFREISERFNKSGAGVLLPWIF